MRLVNQTNYDTRTLRSILTAVHNAETRGRLATWERCKVVVAYGRKGNRKYTGHAYFSGLKCHLSVPKGGLDVIQFAAVWRHELWHLCGVRNHGDYPSSIRYGRPSCVDHVDLTRFGASMAERGAKQPIASPPAAPSMHALESMFRM